jgi:hypothetical protein
MRRAIKRKLHNLRALIRHRHILKKVVDAHVYFLEHRAVSVWGGISETDELGIRVAVAKAAPFDGPIVEIGALFGWTTQLLASLKSPAKELIAVDNYCWNPFMLPEDDHRVITRRTLYYCLEHCRTQLFDGSTQDFYDSYAGPVPSMVFIDADHSYREASRDIAWARSLGVPVIAGHDYQSLHPGVMKAVDENFGTEFEVFGSVWIAEGVQAAAAVPLARAA